MAGEAGKADDLALDARPARLVACCLASARTTFGARRDGRHGAFVGLDRASLTTLPMAATRLSRSNSTPRRSATTPPSLMTTIRSQ
jgi:hypothetical protein